MTFQVRCVSIYSHDGRRRDVPFEPGKLNIITGSSETGKSTVVRIINYCLGAGTYRIPVDVIHDSCSWFSVLFEKPGSSVFIARPRLPEGQKSHSAACVVVGAAEPLAPSDLVVNANTDFILEKLGSFAGIGDIQTAPEEGRTTEPIQPSIKHARDLVLQPQSVLASEKHILYGTDDYWQQLHLRDCMPYFLGVVGEDISQKRTRMRELRREVKLMEMHEQRMSSFSDRVIQETSALLSNAIDAGMTSLPSSVQNAEEAIELVRQIADWVETEESCSAIEGDELTRLRDQLVDIEAEINSAKGQLESAQAFAIRASTFADEGARQDSRVKLISVFGNHSSSPACPLCDTRVDAEKDVLDKIIASSKRLTDQLSVAERQRPRLAKYLEELRGEIAERQRKSEQLKRSVYAIIESRNVLRERREASFRRARVSGHASAVLASLKTDAKAATDGPKKRKLMRELKKLEEMFADDAIAEKMKAAETVISSNVTKYAMSMSLAQADTPLVFDLQELTLKFAIGLQTVSLDRIGAQKNWVGYHIAVILALHDWFGKNRSPIPGFAVIDQVSQPFFSNESLSNPERGADDLVDEDREQVLRMIKELREFCDDETRGRQIILTEHISSNEPWFMDSVVETWRRGVALVPNDWPRK